MSDDFDPAPVAPDRPLTDWELVPLIEAKADNPVELRDFLGRLCAEINDYGSEGREVELATYAASHAALTKLIGDDVPLYLHHRSPA